MLNYTDGSISFSANFHESIGPIWMAETQCVGDEASIFDCPSLDVGDYEHCSHEYDASVICFNNGKSVITDNKAKQPESGDLCGNITEFGVA